MADTRPQTGDLVVRYRHRAEAFFVLNIWGGGGSQETTCTTYREALSLAKRAAEPSNSAVWYTDDGLKFSLLLSFREIS
ncbi:MAG TPA: hypothetical protein VLV86_07930 [Vicinamibacterales bacterium]|nr:hypothetical protein [Vicinamibacterales bacterium]